MGNDIVVKKQDLVAMIENHGIGDVIKPLIKEIYLFDSYIAGISYLKDQSVLEKIQVEEQLILQREDNKFDSNAILVLTQKNEKLGYIPEKDNIVFARLMDAGKLLSARIQKVEKKGSYTRVKIGIYLIDF